MQVESVMAGATCGKNTRINKTIYFDNAATTFPKPESVYSFMDSFYRTQGGNVGRGQYKLTAAAGKITSETRLLLGQLLDCQNKDILFTPSATIALNMIIQGTVSKMIAQGKTPVVYITRFEHNAVTRTLFHYEKHNQISVCFLSLKNDFSYDLEKIREDFKAKNPDFVICSHASNVCGLICPVQEIFAQAKNYDAITLTDIAQTAALVPLQVGSDLIDYAVFAGHKTLYGPFGIAGFAKKRNLDLEPVLFGGTGVESALQDMPQTLPVRYEMGSQNIQAIAGLHAALKWWSESKKEIRAKENAAHRTLVELLNRYDFIHIVGPYSTERFSEKTPCIGVVSCTFEGYSPDEIGNVLDEQNIAVRTGLQCSPFAHKALGTFPAGTVRFSVGAFTSDEDFAALEGTLEYIERNR